VTVAHAPDAPARPARLPIRIGRRSALPLRVVFGVRPDNAWVEASAEWITIRFGRFGMRIPVGDVTGWRIEGPWRWITAIGVRMGLRHRDVSFAGSPRGGVRIDLRSPVRWGPLNVPAVYVGVDDLEAFAGALTALGVPGVDARRSSA
jgi:hypothetical protein